MTPYQNKYRAESNRWQYWNYCINTLCNYGFDIGVSIIRNDGRGDNIDKIHEFYIPQLILI